MGNEALSEMCRISSLNHQKKEENLLLELQRLIGVRPPSPWNELTPWQSVLALQILWSCWCWRWWWWWWGCNKKRPSWRFWCCLSVGDTREIKEARERTGQAWSRLALWGLLSLITVQPSKVMVNSTCLWSPPFLSASVFISLLLPLSHFFFAHSPLDASAHLPDSVINLRLQPVCRSTGWIHGTREELTV